MYMDSNVKALLWDTQYIMCSTHNAFSAAMTRGLISVCKGCRLQEANIDHPSFYSLFTHYSLLGFLLYYTVQYITITVQYRCVRFELLLTGPHSSDTPVPLHRSPRTIYTTPLHHYTPSSLVSSPCTGIRVAGCHSSMTW